MCDLVFEFVFDCNIWVVVVIIFECVADVLVCKDATQLFQFPFQFPLVSKISVASFFFFLV